MSLIFHACPPQGEWLNDPNALWHDGERYRLLAQHRADGPTFQATGWAALSSLDLFDWRFDGVPLPPEGEAWNYSGCLVAVEDGLEAIHTVREAGLERQVARPGLGAAIELPTLGPPGRNRRDAQAFRWEDEWWLLLAEPCDWHDWRGRPASRLTLHASSDRRNWREIGTIGPFHPPGVMWEVPLLLPIDGRWVLIVSLVDRRDDATDCSVGAWIGDFDGARFAPDRPEGQRLDYGPDFYAAMAALETGWPGSPALVGWLSSWATARKDIWPGFWGGPVSLPRTVSIHRDRLVVAPRPGLAQRFASAVEAVPPAGLARLPELKRIELTTNRTRCLIAADGDALLVERQGDGLDWSGRFDAALSGPGEALLFRDGPAIELFIGGTAVSLALPGEHLRVSGADARWSTLVSPAGFEPATY